MKFQILKYNEIVSYFDLENFKGGTIVRNQCNKCKKKIVLMNKKVDTIILAIGYEAN